MKTGKLHKRQNLCISDMNSILQHNKLRVVYLCYSLTEVPFCVKYTSIIRKHHNMATLYAILYKVKWN